MADPVCAAPLQRGPMKGKPATGTVAGNTRHYRAGEPSCDACVSASRERVKGIYWADPERWRLYFKTWRSDPERYERQLTASRRWKEANPEKVRRWKQTNRHRVVEYEQRRRSRKAGTSVASYTIDQLSARMAFWGNRCWMCGGPFEHVDHVKPLAAGGAHVLANLRPACQRCNLSKNDTWPLEAAMKGAPNWETYVTKWA